MYAVCSFGVKNKNGTGNVGETGLETAAKPLTGP
jgi:hypothetical protein